MNICIFGDSITWGSRLPFRVGWANLLRNYLEHTAEDYYAVYDLGIDKDTSAGLLNRFEREAAHRDPGLIIFAIGTNDSAFRMHDDRSGISSTVFADNLRQLVTQAKRLTNQLVFVGLAKGDDALTMPLPQSTTGKAYSKDKIMHCNQIIKAIAAETGAAFVDIAPLLTDSDFDDGLHPNQQGHQKIYEAVLKVLTSILQIEPVAKTLVVNAQNEIIAYKQRTTVRPSDIVRIAALWLENELGEVLIVQRAMTKLRDPGMWGPACAQTLNEIYDEPQAALTYALMHKLHLDLNSRALMPTPLAQVRQETLFVDGTASGDRSFFVQLFFAQVKKAAVTPVINPIEIAAYRWCTKDALRDELQQGKLRFVQDFARYLELS